ncbi:unnamed protein product [Microthlaspi erraticum]|uniref:Uncharacterized protein n=1 Tax=Microthlaspi erraticum TaxID=1685480 RepID=A0A6D2I5E4_9BRAS|nr:unnamed protein product [Microthlaspi erraticum]
MKYENSKQQSKATVHRLFEISTIMPKLPATSLTRLRSTCKRWNRLFNDRSFAIKHFHKATKQSLYLMLKTVGFCSVSINLHRPIEVTGELNLINPQYSLDEFEISNFCYSDGLLLCVCANKKIALSILDTKLVIWNPCTGESKWIQPIHECIIGNRYSFGSYQDKKTGTNSYKILSDKYSADPKLQFRIHEINSNSWRNLDVALDFELGWCNVSLKGKTYWIGTGEKEKRRGTFLVSFDYTTERFKRLSLPRQYPSYEALSLSVVREEKLCVLLKREITVKTEVWVTNKIGETKAAFWSKVFAVDFTPPCDASFLVDEEKKLLVCSIYDLEKLQHMAYTVGEDNKVMEKAFGSGFRPFLFNYVPSLTQIEQVTGTKRKRGE